MNTCRRRPSTLAALELPIPWALAQRRPADCHPMQRLFGSLRFRACLASRPISAHHVLRRLALAAAPRRLMQGAVRSSAAIPTAHLAHKPQRLSAPRVDGTQALRPSLPPMTPSGAGRAGTAAVLYEVSLARPCSKSVKFSSPCSLTTTATARYRERQASLSEPPLASETRGLMRCRRHAAALALLALLVSAGFTDGQEQSGRRGGRPSKPRERVGTFGDVQVRGGCFGRQPRAAPEPQRAGRWDRPSRPAAIMLALRAFPLQPERLEATRKLLNNLERHWRLSPVATPRTRQLAELAALARSRVDSVRGRMPSVPGRKRFQYVSMPVLHIGETEEAAKTAAAYFATVRAVAAL